MDEPSSPVPSASASDAPTIDTAAIDTAEIDAAAIDVTALPPLPELLDALTDQLAAWMPAQRWYARKGTGTPDVSIRGWAPLRVADDHLTVLVVLAAAVPGSDPEDASARTLYQVPLVLRRPDESVGRREEGSEVGVLAVPGGPLRVDDATLDADGRAALIATLVSGDGALGPSLALASHRTVPDGPLPLGRAMRSRPLSGEQSNSSMIIETEGASPLILKLFRVLQHGQNPDVVLQGALTAAGSTRVAPLVGSATIRVGGVRTQSLLAQEFLPDVEDAWRTALRLALAGEDFTGPAQELGAAVAEVHRDLAAALGTVPAEGAAVAEMVKQMRSRLMEVAAEVPRLSAHRPTIEALYAAAAEVRWPPLQRIHGDLHLGQVLRAPDRGWVLLDFEGEPLRPLAQRSRPDCPLRDVAGMLRSLDYVSGAVAHEHARDAAAWTAASRSAFLAGYGAQSGQAPDPRVLAAFEADKAVYEALYEARNRPDWLPIPLAALERISAAAAEAGSAG
ncbi:maltokinase N-terminal cap-like domain-containing protein [Brachybacterium fresconis]|uniref:Maltokinase n=1 Tax=Brachybacterium fresconis TaxID=173363 RepID=A0ABS4YJS9_9MICO|nr:phosphotransferase [Brachybacterium fresconis]MBP2408855.1 putative trehalose synthase [Brachybacterium fresconis]